jgi:hypothetical protein
MHVFILCSSVDGISELTRYNSNSLPTSGRLTAYDAENQVNVPNTFRFVLLIIASDSLCKVLWRQSLSWCVFVTRVALIIQSPSALTRADPTPCAFFQEPVFFLTSSVHALLATLSQQPRARLVPLAPLRWMGIHRLASRVSLARSPASQPLKYAMTGLLVMRAFEQALPQLQPATESVLLLMPASTFLALVSLRLHAGILLCLHLTAPLVALVALAMLDMPNIQTIFQTRVFLSPPCFPSVAAPAAKAG